MKMMEEENMFSKKSLIVSVIISLLCIVIGVVCAFLLHFDLVSIAMLAGIATLSIIINVFCWREIAAMNKEK